MSTDVIVPVAEQQSSMDSPVGSRLLTGILAEVESRQARMDSEYNERYIDKGPAWGEHINYRDGGQHGQTHRNKYKPE